VQTVFCNSTQWIEKAHPAYFQHLILQVLDDGRLTDNKGVWQFQEYHYHPLTTIWVLSLSGKAVAENTGEEWQKKRSAHGKHKKK
jgi:hypothetical protein